MKKDKTIFKDASRDPNDHKTKERVKKTGEVFTSPVLINQMLDHIDTSLFKPGMTFLEPAARNREHGHRVSKA